MKRKLFLITACLFIGIGWIMAQTRTITGVVISEEDNEPVIGASVLVTNTDIGTATNLDGEFVLSNVPASATTLRISYLGMQTVEVPISAQRMGVMLQSDSEMLEEVVITGGYGSGKKLGSIVSSVSVVNSQKLKNQPTVNFADALQGQVAGLSVLSSSGEPSATASIRLRGVNSVTAMSTPLFILDGTPVSQVIFSTMNPNDIENITVLKDASATAIYGSRAANGVIIITSKKGKMGQNAQVTFRAQYGVSNIIDNGLKMMNSEQYMTFREMLDPNLTSNQEWVNHKKVVQDNGINTNWRDEIFQDNAPTYNLDLSVSGGGSNNNYYLSLAHNNTEGIAPLSKMNRTALRSNLEVRVNDWFKVGLNSNLAFQKYNQNPDVANAVSQDNPAAFARYARPDDASRYYTLDENGKAIYGDRADFLHESRFINPLYAEDYRKRNHENFAVNLSLFEEIRPAKGLILRTVQALDGFDNTYSGKTDPVESFTTPMGDYIEGNNGLGSSREMFQRFWRFTFTNTAEYKFNIENKHFVTLLLGQESILSKDRSFDVSVRGISDKRLQMLSNGTEYLPPTDYKTETVFNSFFFRADYSFKEKYFLDASYRLDGSSKFTPQHRWAEFYAIGGKWNLKSEDFLKDANWVQDLGVRLSYGTTGNSQIGDYIYYSLLSSNQVSYENQGGVVITQPGNPNLTWETITSTNLGFDFRFLKRISGSLDLYYKKTTDMLMFIPYSYTTGFSGSLGNIGGMENKGVDLSLNIDILSKKDFYWSFRTSLNYNKNEITELFNGLDEYLIPDTGTKLKIGHSQGDMYMVRRAGVDPRDGKIIWYDKNGNQTKIYNENDAVFVGKQQFAPWSGGFGTNLSWKGFTASVDFSFALGKYMINNERMMLENPNAYGTSINQSKNVLNMWTTPGQITNIPAATERIYLDDSFIENASFLRLRNITLSYSLPESFMKKTRIFKTCNVFAVGRNLLTFTKFNGYDPEPDSNLIMFDYPNTSQYSFGFEVSF